MPVSTECAAALLSFRYPSLLVIAISKCQTCQHTPFFGGIWQVGKLRERKKKEKKTQVTVVPKMSTDHLFFHLPNPTPLC